MKMHPPSTFILRTLQQSLPLNLHVPYYNVFQYLESNLHTLVVVTSGKPQAGFQVVKINLCKKEEEGLYNY